MSSTKVVEAYNTSADSPNRIHGEEARQHGFKGGLVPGVTLFAYLVGALVEEWGEPWMSEGQMEARFRRPVYHGEPITLSYGPGDDGSNRTVEIRNADDELCVAGVARRHRDDFVPDLADYPSRPLPEPPFEEGTPERFSRDGRLGDYPVETDPETVYDWLDKIGEDREIFRTVLHPVQIAKISNKIVARQFEIKSPRIAVSLRARFYGTGHVGEHLTARGQVARVWERKGSHYLGTDIVIVNEGGEVIMHVEHEGIFKLKSKN